MEMCYDGALVMPNNCMVISEDEMTYLEGGVSLSMNVGYLSKSVCNSTGTKYSASTGLSKTRIAQEVYAHAVMYYASPVAFYVMTKAVSSLTDAAAICLNWIRSHSNPIDIGGDSSTRVSIYNIIWNVF